MVNHTETNPVFIIGHGRSGTSITAQLMREHLDVAFGTESQFITRYHKRLASYGDLENDANLRRLIDHILTERWFQRSRKFDDFTANADAIFADVQSRDFRGVLDAVFGQLAKHLNMPRYGDKTPEYNHDLPVLGELYPDARYIHVVRDGRDVAMSMLAMYVMPKHLFLAAKDWCHHVDLIDEFTKDLPPEQLMIVRYEDLLTDPVSKYMEIAEYLRIDDSSGDLRPTLEKEMAPKLNRANFDKWKTALSKEQIRCFEEVACETLNRHGYETEVTEPGPEPALAKRAMWNVQSKLSLWRRPRYWSEHIHRVHIRSRDALRSLFK